jgi:hypothetical protein
MQSSLPLCLIAIENKETLKIECWQVDLSIASEIKTSLGILLG